MFTSTVRLQYKFRVVKDTNDICIPLTVVQATAIIAQEKNICNFPVKVIPKSNDCLIVDKIEDKITLEGSVFFDYEGIWKNGNWYKSWVK
ncbi:MAG: hypothetical protein CMF30_02975 [Kiritimatiellaceae bacterium]|nr:hypothetical protein [Kiritimatiellaceae bacterium]